MRAAAFAVYACLLTTAGAMAAPPTAPQDRPPINVSPVTVVPLAPEPPKVVSTWPAAGAAVTGGVMVLTVTFDQQMAPGAFSVTPTTGADKLQCLKTPRLLNDGKTFALLCTAQEKQRYALAFNAQPSGGFANLADQRATPSSLEFSTTDADGPRSIAEALKAENLPTLAMPIQDAPDSEVKPK